MNCCGVGIMGPMPFLNTCLISTGRTLYTPAAIRCYICRFAKRAVTDHNAGLHTVDDEYWFDDENVCGTKQVQKNDLGLIFGVPGSE